MITRPRSLSTSIERRTVLYATPYSVDRSRSGGSRVPRLNSPSSMRAAMDVGELERIVLERWYGHSEHVTCHMTSINITHAS